MSCQRRRRRVTCRIWEVRNAMQNFLRALILACATAASAALAQEADAPLTLPRVDVIRQAPLPGFDIPRARYPGNAQQADEAARHEAGASNLPDFMSRR